MRGLSNRNGELMRALVTGGAGFIGSHLVDKLLSEGHEVIVLDDFSTGSRGNLPSNTTNLMVYDIDISRDPFDFAGVDTVFHLAAKADIVPSIKEPIKYHNANVTGTINILELARAANVRRFVYAASASRYGMAGRGPGIDPKYPYALTKVLGEWYVDHWHDVYKMSTCSLRFFNVFGPRARSNSAYGAVFGVFLAQIANSKPLTVVGDGSQERDFIYVSDVVEALLQAGQAEECGAFDIGLGKSHEVAYLAKLLQGRTSHINYVPERPGEPESTVANIERAKRYLRWAPKVEFEDGVKLMLKELPKYKDAPVWTPATIEAATADWFKYLS